jgi:hypothetical protein
VGSPRSFKSLRMARRWTLPQLRALRDSGAISAAEFEIRKSAMWRRHLGDRSGRPAVNDLAVGDADDLDPG